MSETGLEAETNPKALIGRIGYPNQQTHKQVYGWLNTLQNHGIACKTSVRIHMNDFRGKIFME